MTEYKYGAMRRNARSGMGDRPYYYRPSHSPPRTEVDGQAYGRKGSALFVIAVLFLISAVIGCILFGFFSSYFNLKTVRVTGISEHSEEEIIALSGIEIGKKLYHIDSKEIEEKILASYPEIAQAKVEKILPSEIHIALTYEIPKYYISVTGEYFTLSDSLRVLERFSDKKALEGTGLTYVTMPNVKRALTGERLEFFEGDDEYIERFLSVFSESSFCGDVDKIYIGGKFDISLVKTGKYKIEMGDFKDEALKLKMAEKVIETGGYREMEGVVLNVSDVSESSVMVHKTLKIE